MTAQPKHNADQTPPPSGEADIILFRARSGEEIDPNKLSPAECVSYFIHKWHHPSRDNRPIADVINTDTTKDDGSDAWQQRVQRAVHESPLFDHYDELIEADPVTRLLDSVMRSTQPAKGAMTAERTAMGTLMYMRASEVLERPEENLGLQLERLPLGDERMWEELAHRLASEHGQ